MTETIQETGIELLLDELGALLGNPRGQGVNLVRELLDSRSPVRPVNDVLEPQFGSDRVVGMLNAVIQVGDQILPGLDVLGQSLTHRLQHLVTQGAVEVLRGVADTLLNHPANNRNARGLSLNALQSLTHHRDLAGQLTRGESLYPEFLHELDVLGHMGVEQKLGTLTQSTA